jgi:hypothetical protein
LDDKERGGNPSRKAREELRQRLDATQRGTDHDDVASEKRFRGIGGQLGVR